MPRLVPYLSEYEIERDAATLLDEYSQKRGVAITPPIPIDDIVEKYLKLGIEFDDMHRLLNHPRSGFEPDILGAIYFDERRIVIDESLDPDENPWKETRYRYTLAHEGGGHWRLHRHLFIQDLFQAVLFGGTPPPSVVCRSNRVREPIEWQADFYASCLLMPRNLVMDAWKAIFQDFDPWIIPPRPPATIPPNVEFLTDFHLIEVRDSETDDEVLNRIAHPFAKKFMVSTIAMRIR